MHSTTHRLYLQSAQHLTDLSDQSVALVVTSPPYPMVEMWDDILAQQNPAIQTALAQKQGMVAFELMHQQLDEVWQEVVRVVQPSGFVCINIGDATRTIGGEFQLYSNHSRIVQYFVSQGFMMMPAIIWRKPTNAPNKFMGSGMLPAGAYVTLEHEYILVFRKGGKRIFKTEAEKQGRQESAYFWEERNQWFSDVWEIRGTTQKISADGTRERSAAYPLEIPYRLINMYSVKGDTVLDPFLGTGSTTWAAIAAQRHSVGYEIDPSLFGFILEEATDLKATQLNARIRQRLQAHAEFVSKRQAESKPPLKHFNPPHQMPVMTRQEIDLRLVLVSGFRRNGNEIIATY